MAAAIMLAVFEGDVVSAAVAGVLAMGDEVNVVGVDEAEDDEDDDDNECCLGCAVGGEVLCCCC